ASALFTNAPVHSLGSARAALATEAIVTCGAAFKTSLTVVSFLARRGTGSAECTCHCVIRIISQSYAARGHSPTNTRRDLLQDRRLPYRSDGDSGKSRHYTRSRRPRPARPWRRACHAGDARSHAPALRRKLCRFDTSDSLRRDGHALLPEPRHRAWTGRARAQREQGGTRRRYYALSSLDIEGLVVPALPRSGDLLCLGMDARAGARAPASGRIAAGDFRSRRLG